LFAGRYYWLDRTAFPAGDPNTEIETVIIERIDFRDSDIEPMIIKPLPAAQEIEDMRTFSSHQLVSPIEVNLCNETILPILFGFFGLTAAEVVGVQPDADDLRRFGFVDENNEMSYACKVTIQTPDETFVLTIGTHVASDTGVTLGWFGMSSHVPGLVFMFEPDTMPWVYVTIDHIISASIFMPYIYSIDRLILETADQNLEFTIVGDAQNNRVYLGDEQNRSQLEGTIRNADSDRGRFANLYLFLLAARTDSVFIGDTPPNAEFLARITYHFRDGDTQVIEYFSADTFQSIVSMNGQNLFKTRASYTTRLISNIEAFADGGEIITDV
jgi:hypothetical protein